MTHPNSRNSLNSPNSPKKSGFSLVELLVVVTIIAILSVVAYTAVSGQTGKARDAKRKEAISQIQSALEIYFIENNNTYPTELDDENTNNPETDLVPKYMPKMPKDPVTNNKYSYVVSGKTYQIAATLEEDGTPKAYVVGNSTTDLINGIGTPSCGKVIDNGSCLPYAL
ncbi:type II secretion system protein [Candidatus Peregrinibacteria bacterium]|nr:type II secretion system protein [Candidatus Peregrinibacteria bacterium]